MQNLASQVFGALPERLAILESSGEEGGGDVNILRFLGGKGPEEYSVNECRKVLENICNTMN